MKNWSKIAALLLLWVIPSGIFVMAYHTDWRKVWKAVGVNSMTPTFLDLRSIAAGVRTYREGGDPLVDNPADSLHRSLNYPRVWLYSFLILGINEGNVWMVGLVFAGLYLLCISKLIFDARDVWEEMALLLSGLSVSAFFALERGTNDLLIFALVFGGCLLSKPAGRAGIFLVAMLLKFFPLVALVAEAIRQRGRNRVWAIALSILGMVLLAAQWRDLVLIQRGTPVSAAASYGIAAFREVLWRFLAGHGHLGSGAHLACELVASCSRVTAFAAVFVAWRAPSPIDGALLQSRRAHLFFIFGTIYAATFALGSNWDYRLIFLAPTLPFAFELLRTPGHFRWGLSYVLLVLVAEDMAAFWWDFRQFFAQGASLILFVQTLVILVRQTKAHLGLAIEGDSQRLGLSDPSMDQSVVRL